MLVTRKEDVHTHAHIHTCIHKYTITHICTYIHILSFFILFYFNFIITGHRKIQLKIHYNHKNTQLKMT